MNKHTIKEYLIKWLEENPDLVRDAFNEAVNYLRERESLSPQTSELDQAIDDVFDKYDEVFRKLA
jgi:hypothetical protein